MRKIKFNKFERIAGVFAGVSGLLVLFSMLSVAVKQGWFETRIHFVTEFVDADGVHAGTAVQMAGLKAGTVDEVGLTKDNKIQVHFYVLSRFRDKIKEDSVVQLIRPFVIGERVLEVSVGSETSPLLATDSHMKSNETVDLMTVMSGKHLGQYLASMGEMMTNLRTLAEAFLAKDRTQALINMFDRIDPLLKNLNAMSVEFIKLGREANKDGRFGTVLSGLATTTQEINTLLPEFSERAPELADGMMSLVKNMADLTGQMKVFIPALAEIAPDLPHASRRAVEALDEAVVLMKAIQKSFLVSGKVEEVRQEEAQRKPASEGKK